MFRLAFAGAVAVWGSSSACRVAAGAPEPPAPKDPAASGAKRPDLDTRGGKRNGHEKGGVTWTWGKAPRHGGFPWRSALRREAPPPAKRLVAHRKDQTSAPQGYYEYTPAGYPGGVKWPLLVSLHGIGENGNGNDHLIRVAQNGIPKVIAENRWHGDRPHVVLAPQHDSWGCPKPAAVKAFISWALENYAVDPARVYLAGSSCGANTIWEYLSEYLNTQVAAAVVIAGDGREAWKKSGCSLKKVAIWAFHGHLDEVVDPAGTHVPLDGLSRCPSPEMVYKKTIYPALDHGAWYRTYGDMSGHDIYDWMLQFEKGTSGQ